MHMIFETFLLLYPFKNVHSFKPKLKRAFVLSYMYVCAVYLVMPWHIPALHGKCVWFLKHACFLYSNLKCAWFSEPKHAYARFPL